MRPTRTAAALALALTGVAGSGSAAIPLLQAGAADFPTLLAGTLCAVHALASAWLLVVVLALASGHAPRRIAPRWLVVALMVGGGLAPGAAVADPADHLGGLPLPDRAVTPSLPPPPETPQQTHPGPDHGAHTVAQGDTLWAIAGDRLPAGAPDAAVATAVGRWHAANHAVIGDDPDLIRPGQVLTPPQEPPS